MRVSRNIDFRTMGAAEYIVKYVEKGSWQYPQQNERRWTLHRNIELCRSIDEDICLGLLTIEITDDGRLVNIIDGRERTAVLYEMLHPEARTDGKRLLMIVGQDIYTQNDFRYTDADYKLKPLYEYWVSDVAETFNLSQVFRRPPFREKGDDGVFAKKKMSVECRFIEDRLLTFNKYFQRQTVGISLVSFHNETCGDSIEIQRLRLRGRLNRT